MSSGQNPDTWTDGQSARRTDNQPQTPSHKGRQPARTDRKPARRTTRHRSRHPAETIIIKRIFIVPINSIKWERRALYNNTNNTLCPPPTHTPTHTLDGLMDTDVKKKF